MGHGGKRAGAGRPAGSGWTPAVGAMRVAAAAKMRAIVDADNDPLTILVGMVLNDALDAETRLGAASIAMPFLYPKLTASKTGAGDGQRLSEAAR